MRKRWETKFMKEYGEKYREKWDTEKDYMCIDMWPFVKG